MQLGAKLALYAWIEQKNETSVVIQNDKIIRVMVYLC